MSQNEAGLVHEAEAQRQHIRIELPASATVDGVKLKVLDWSNGGLALRIPEIMQELPPVFSRAGSHALEVDFTFEGFALTLPLTGEVSYIDRDNGRLGIRFTNLSRRQISIIRFLVSSYMSGELIQMGDLLDVVERNNFTRARGIPKAETSFRQGLGKWMRIVAIAALSAALVVYVASSLYEKLFMVTATSAEVSAEMLSVDAEGGGKVFYAAIPTDSLVKRDQPLFTISTATDSLITTTSPCDCIYKRRLFENNRLVRKGEPVLELALPDAEPFVEAYIPHKQAVNLAVGQETLLALPGHGDYLRGVIQTIQAGKSIGGNAHVVITPKEPLPVSYIDDPVEVRIDTLGWW